MKSRHCYSCYLFERMEHCTLNELIKLSFLGAFTSFLHCVPAAQSKVANGYFPMFSRLLLNLANIAPTYTFFFPSKGHVKSGNHRDPLARCMSSIMRELYVKRVESALDYFLRLRCSGESQYTCVVENIRYCE